MEELHIGSMVGGGLVGHDASFGAREERVYSNKITTHVFGNVYFGTPPGRGFFMNAKQVMDSIQESEDMVCSSQILGPSQMEQTEI
jgi:hypothetical protein